MYEYLIESKIGCLVLHDGKDHWHISFKSFTIYSDSSRYTTIGDYVIFRYNNEQMRLEVEEIIEYCQDYDSLNLDSIDPTYSTTLKSKYCF